MKIKDSGLLETYLKQAVGQDNIGLFRCNMCGDSMSNSRAKSAGLIYSPSTDEWVFKCFRAGCAGNQAILAQRWLKKYYPSIYRDYSSKLFRSNSFQDLVLKSKKSIVVIKVSAEKKDLTEKENWKKFLQADKELLFKAIELLNSKKISSSYWQEMMIAEKGKYAGRLMIPVEKDYWQGRTLVGHSGKYKNFGGKKDDILWMVDENNGCWYQPVTICEGIFSAMSVVDSISTLGCNVSDIQIERIKKTCTNIRWWFDDDEAGILKMKQLCKKGETVFSWKKFKTAYPHLQKCNDSNDVYVEISRGSMEKINIEKLEWQKYFVKGIAYLALI